MKLIIGNKNYSSWSLRAWLLLAAHEVPFTEVRIPLSMPETASEIRQYNAAGKVPVLHDRNCVIWDSIAICEYVSEQYLDGKGWPEDWQMRAEARSCCAEMHSGFFVLREKLPMNCRASGRNVPITPALKKDISRIDDIWNSLRAQSADQGPWLCGNFTIADCMFAPVVFRFQTYGIGVSNISRDYMDALLAHPQIRQWIEQAEKESEVVAAAEVGK